MFTKRYWNTFDYTLVLLVTILVIIGIITIGSAIHINLGESATDRNKQILFFSVGLILMGMSVAFDYNFIGKFYIVIYIVNILLLIAVLIFGSEVNGATRWIQIGWINLQPSEFAKIVTILVVSKLIDKNKDKINNIFVLILIIGLAMFPVLLIKIQPSLSASLVIVAILIIEIFIAKINYKYILTTCALGLCGISFVFWDIQRSTSFLKANKILDSFQIDRILPLINPSQYKTFQTDQSINAIGSGQLYGKGLYNGTLSQLNYLSESHNDFIFSVIGEEFGFVGCSIVLGILFLIVVKCIIVAAKAEDFYGRLIASGVAGMIAFQVFVHVGVTMGFLPNTGMPLPFVSYGGSSMWTNMIAVGLVLNVGTKRVKTFF